MTPTLSTQTLAHLRKDAYWQVLLTLATGLSLIPLLFWGWFQNISGLGFQSSFVAHIVILSSAVFYSLRSVLTLSLKNPVFSLLPLLSFLFLLGCTILIGLAPITSRDALIHHLAVPRWWVEADKIFPTFWHEWSFYPMLLNLGYCGLLSHGLESLTSAYHLCYLILLCGVVAEFTYYKTSDAKLAVLGFVFTFSLPICLRLASSPLVDLGLALYSTLAIVCVTYWLETKGPLWMLVGSGISLGLALSSKYNGLLASAAFFPLVIIFGKQAEVSAKCILKMLLVTGIVSLIVYSPWLIKNALWTGNPLFPLYKGLFGGFSNPSAGAGLTPLEQQLYLYQHSWLHVISLPIQMLLNGEDNNPARFDGVLSPLLLFLCLPVLRAKKQPWVVLFFVFVLVYTLFAIMLSGARIRYLAPVYGCSLILLTVGIDVIGEWFHTSRRNLILTLFLVVQLFFSVPYTLNLVQRSDALPYVQGEVSKDSYLRRHIPGYSMITRANQIAGPHNGIYPLFTGNEYYYFTSPIYNGGHFSAAPLLSWLKTSSSTEQLVEEFSDRNISYLLINIALLRQAFEATMTSAQGSLWNKFQSENLTLIDHDGPFSLWKITPPKPEGSQP